MNRALFLDRDGVINEDYGYVHKIEDFHFREGIFDVCREAQQAGMKIIVVTNQAGIGRGFYTEEDYKQITLFMITSFQKANVSITGVYHCPYHPLHGIKHYKRDSYDRKPNPGMLLKAIRDHRVSPEYSIMVGDKPSDELASSRAGIPIFVDSTSKTWHQEVIHYINCSFRRLNSTSTVDYSSF